MVDEKELQVLVDEKGFRIVEQTQEYVEIEGLLNINHEYAGVKIVDEYRIAIKIPNGFPNKLPVVYDKSSHIPEEFEHFYDNGGVCLGTMCDLIDFLEKNPSIIAFFEKVICSYFYASSFFRRYGYAPFGERSHGSEGIFESYCERYNAVDEWLLGQLLLVATGFKPYRGHEQCPCGSGLKFRNCHGPNVLHDLQADAREIYKQTAMEAMASLLKKYKEKKIYG